MKWIQISCILIIFAFGLIYAESKSSEEDDYCFNQYINRSRLVEKCIDSIFNESEFMSELMANLVHYSGDNAAVHALSDKYCPILHQTLQCSNSNYGIDKECQTPYTIAKKRQEFEVTSALLNYICANSSAVLLRILESNGLETIYENENFKQCVKLTNQIHNKDVETLGISHTISLCDGADKIYECYSNMVREHVNQNLIEIAKEVHTLYRQTINCNSTNEV